MSKRGENTTRTRIVPFALGGFVVWLLMRRNCSPCSTGAGSGAGAGETGVTGKLATVYWGSAVGFAYPDARSEQLLYYGDGMPTPPDGYQAVVEQSMWVVTKVTRNPKFGGKLTIAVGDKLRVIGKDASGAWKVTNGF